jgi:predicted nucleic acid-binding protein
MTGIDTNVLAQLCLSKHPQHVSAVSAIQNEAQLGNILLLTPSIVAEYLHIITDPRRFADALTISQALDWIEQFLSNMWSVRLLEANEAGSRQGLAWLREFQLGRKRILDTDFAGQLYVAGCRRILTSNPTDFALFKVFEIISP